MDCLLNYFLHVHAHAICLVLFQTLFLHFIYFLGFIYDIFINMRGGVNTFIRGKQTCNLCVHATYYQLPMLHM